MGEGEAVISPRRAGCGGCDIQSNFANGSRMIATPKVQKESEYVPYRAR